ncbi:MAG: hypothetical protein Q8P24_13255 [Desulfobacterales bacterium]|nr:hypothetical protein [Desulfobacterales bacterium]
MTLDQLHALHAKIGLIVEALMDCEGIPDHIFDMLEEINTIVYKETKKRCTEKRKKNAD